MNDLLAVGKTPKPSRASSETGITCAFIAPPPEFEGCFTSFYKLGLKVAREGQRVRDFLQPEWANIRFFGGSTPTTQIGETAISGARFCSTGPSSLPNEFRLGSVQMWGIGFLPLGWARFFDVPACEVANIVVDGSAHPAFQKFDILSDILCDPHASHEQQLEAIIAVMRQLARPNRDDVKIMRVHKALLDKSVSTVAYFADRVGMSVRTLERICLRYFGFSPKFLMRRQRLIRSLTNYMLHADTNWISVIDDTYHDQAHFTREFREFMTMTPSEYAALDHPILKAFMVARAQSWGSAAQALDTPDR